MSEIIKNLTRAVKRALTTGASVRAIESAQPYTFKAAQDSVKGKKPTGKRGSFNRRIVGYERLGPFHRQTGTRIIGRTEMPIMQTFFLHRFLHATKGWREYLGGAAARMPVHSIDNRVPPYPLRFYGKHRFA